MREEEVFPEVISGCTGSFIQMEEREKSFKTSYREYVENQYEKEMAVYAVRDAGGRIENIQKLAAPSIKSQGTRSRDTTCRVQRVIGNLRGATVQEMRQNAAGANSRCLEWSLLYR